MPGGVHQTVPCSWSRHDILMLVKKRVPGPRLKALGLLRFGGLGCLLSTLYFYRPMIHISGPAPANIFLSDADLNALDSIPSHVPLVLLAVNGGFDDMLHNFMCFYSQARPSGRLMMLTGDAALAHQYSGMGHLVFLQQLNATMSATLSFGTAVYQEFMYHRTALVAKLLERGRNVLLADIDAVWLEDPLPYLTANATYDVLGQVEGNTGLCGGFLFLRGSSAITKQMWKEVLEYHRDLVFRMLKAGPRSENEQIYMNTLLKTKYNSTLRALGLDRSLFPDGHLYFDQMVKDGGRLRPAVIHNNWIIGKDKKVARFRAAGLWVVGNGGAVCNKTALHEIARDRAAVHG